MSDRSKALALTVGIALLLNACGGTPAASPAANPSGSGTAAPAAAKTPYEIGAPLQFTGPGAVFAAVQKNAIQLAVDGVNAKGGINGHSVNVSFVDTVDKNDTAVSAFQSLIQKGVLGIVGPTSTPGLQAAMPLADASKVVVMVPAVATEGIADLSPYLHRVSAPESVIVPNAVKALVTQYKPKTAALIFQNDQPFNVSGAKAMEATFAAQNVNIVSSQTFVTADVDFSAQLTKIAQAKPDVLGIAALTQQAIQIVTQARRLGITVPIVANKGFGGTGVISQVGKALDGAIIGVQWSPEDVTPANQDFIKTYKAKFGTDPDEFAAMAYDATNILFDAIKSAGEPATREKVQDYVTKLDSYSGASPKMTFFTTPKGGRDVTTAGAVLVGKDGAWVRLKP
jgi:branched-chain amino acid transport system substrate-binding protein